MPSGPPLTTDPATFSAAELLRLYRGKALSPVEATAAVLARIERFDPAVNAFRLLDPEAALAAARAAEARWQRGTPQGLLDGVPTTIKDLILTRGWPTLRGSRAIAPAQPWRRMRRRPRGCASTVLCCSARPPRPSSVGRR